MVRIYTIPGGMCVMADWPRGRQTTGSKNFLKMVRTVLQERENPASCRLEPAVFGKITGRNKRRPIKMSGWEDPCIIPASTICKQRLTPGYSPVLSTRKRELPGIRCPPGTGHSTTGPARGTGDQPCSPSRRSGRIFTIYKTTRPVISASITATAILTEATKKRPVTTCSMLWLTP